MPALTITNTLAVQNHESLYACLARQLAEFKSRVVEAEVSGTVARATFVSSLTSSILKSPSCDTEQGKNRVVEGKLKDQRLAYDTLRVFCVQSDLLSFRQD